MRGLGAAALVLLGACGGPPPGQCVEPMDCDDGFVCNAPDYAGACAGTVSTAPECDDRGSACTNAKGEAGICWYVDGVCGIEHHCRPPCASDADCVDDELCRADGICTAASCADGELTCAADEVCASDPTAGILDANGCMHPSCVESEDCPADQHCVGGRCFLEYGSCQSPLL